MLLTLDQEVLLNSHLDIIYKTAAFPALILADHHLLRVPRSGGDTRDRAGARLRCCRGSG